MRFFSHEADGAPNMSGPFGEEKNPDRCKRFFSLLGLIHMGQAAGESH